MCVTVGQTGTICKRRWYGDKRLVKRTFECITDASDDHPGFMMTRRASVRASIARGNVATRKKKRYMANVGIEPKTFALLARRSNQLS